MANSRKTKAELFGENEALRARLVEQEQVLVRLEQIIKQFACEAVAANAPRHCEIAEGEQVQESLEEALLKLQKSYKELQAAQEELRRQNEELAARKATEKEYDRYQDLFESAPDGYLVTDAGGLILEANRVAEALLNLPRKVLLGMALSLFIAAEQRSDFMRRLSKFKDSGKFEKWELRIQPREREAFHAEIAIGRAPSPTGAGESIRWSIRDVTERKEAAEQLRHQLTEIESIYNSAPVGLAFFDRELHYVRVNGKLAEMNGIPVVDHIGKTPREIVPDIAPLAEQTAAKIFRTGAPVLDVEFSGTTPSQPEAQRYWKLHWLPLKDTSGDVFGINVVVEETTERKKAEKALRELNETLDRRVAERTAELLASESRYRTLFESIDEGFCIVEVLFDASGKPVDYRFLEANPAFEGQTGLHDAVGKRMRELEPRHEEHWFETYGRIALTGEPKRFTNEAKHLERSYDVYAFRVGRPEERKVAILFKDISQRKRTEEALQEAHNKLQTTLDSITDGLMVLDHNWNITYFSETGAKMIGMRRESLIGGYLWDVFPHAKDTKFYQEYNRAAETGQPGHFVEFYPEPLNKWIECHSYPSEEGLTVYFHDVTERKRAEEALAHERELLQRIFENVPVLFVLWDPRLQRFTLNRHAEVALGWTTADANDGDFMSKVYPDPAYRAEVEAFMQSLQPGWREWSVTAKNGEPIPIDWANIRLTDDTMIGIGVDLRERKRAEMALRESEAKFRDLSESLEETIKQKTAELLKAEHLAAVGQVVTTMAHEVRNPVQAIQMGVEFLREAAHDAPVREEILEEIEYGARMVEETVSELLQYGQPFELEISVVPVRDVVEGALKILSDKLKNISIHVQLERDDEEIPVDVVKFTQVLVNILSNAVDAMPDGGRLTLRSRLLQRDADRLLEIAITDSGHGINQKHMDDIYKPFFTTKARGAGLGLPLSKKIMDAHHGTINIMSKVGEGTTVELTLPIGQAVRVRL